MSRGKIPEWSREDGILGKNEYMRDVASWRRDWGEAWIYVAEVEKGIYKSEFMGGYGEPDITIVENEDITQKEAMDRAKEWMRTDGQEVLVEDFKRDDRIYDHFIDLYNTGSRDVNRYTANEISWNYRILIEYHSEEDGYEWVEGKVGTTQHDEYLILTTSRQRGAVRKEDVTIDIQEVLNTILQEKGLYNDETYKEVMRERVFGESDLPDLEDEVATKIGEFGAENVLRDWRDNHAIEVHEKE